MTNQNDHNNEDRYDRRKIALNRCTYEKNMYAPFEEEIYLRRNSIRDKERSEQLEIKAQIDSATSYVQREDWQNRMARKTLMFLFSVVVIVMYFMGYFS